jgi:aspartyl-tRNA(Asn)/glutamyl-tRNA(Gln) amidotransferase subunit A
MESKIFTYINTSTLPGLDGPMANLCAAVESNISVAGWPTDARSAALENYVALEDATLIQRLRNAGAMLKGRPLMGELGLGLDKDTCGDAINKGFCDLVLKTDTTGEARMAGAGSGCFGFKPSYGIISRFGLIGLVPSMETCGILSRSLETISKTVFTMAGLDERDPSMDESGIDRAMSRFNTPQDSQDGPLTMGVIKEWHAVQNANKDFEQTIAMLGSADVPVEEVSIKDFSLARTVHNVIGTVEASSSAGRFDSVRYGHRTGAMVKNWNDMYIKSRGESFGPLVKAYLFQGGYFQYKNYNAFVDACRIRTRLIETVEKAFETVDLIVLPMSEKTGATCEKPDTVSDLYDAFSLTLLANLTGNPSISIPGPVNEDKIYPALQLMGKRFDDARLLALAARVSDIYTGEIHHEI